ncbi:MAG: corrinoid protein [Candidatus Neomarinimicrobiota bacterium]|jgi:5-methyltetrahydrofolate--homocysteine methyltransferase|nr:corrinoid protein [Candidatus Neomarinimicrobiota bacterium]
MNLLESIKENVVQGHIDATSKYPKGMEGQPGVRELTQQAIDKGLAVEDILTQGLIPAMSIVGERYEKNEIFVPEMLFSAKAMKSGLELIRPLLLEGTDLILGKVIIGTVQGDLHDIGKNLVCMMLEGAGFEIEDLGINVPPQKFLEAAKNNPDALIGMSALLTVTMKNMKGVIDLLRSNGLENKIFIGGAPVTPGFAEEIGAEGYAKNANQAVREAKRLLGVAA